MPGMMFHSRDRIQRKLLGHLLNLVGNLAYALGPGSRRRVGLEAYLQVTVDAIYPMLSTRHLRHCFYHFLLFGETPEATRICERGQRRNVGAPASTWTHADMKALKSIVNTNPDLFLDEIQDEFVSVRNKRFAYSTLWMKLVREVGYSLQVAAHEAMQHNQEGWLDYEATVERIVDNPKMVLFVDKSQKDKQATRRHHMWGIRGVTPVRIEPFFGDDDNPQYTLIAACNVDGFIATACEIVKRARGDNDLDETRGAVDRARFEDYVEHMLCPVLGDYRLGEPNSVVVLDNAIIHHHGWIPDLIRA